ncbi:hypothetical protein C8J57DRAFT_1471111 [Mycena rebaudengoi]|nr:hypothetical protein C8J57DRAFT_1471111 [Mycena rebaudengoi]
MEARGNEPSYPKQGGEFERVSAVTTSMAGGLGVSLVLRVVHMGGLMLRAMCARVLEEAGHPALTLGGSAGAGLALDGGCLAPARLLNKRWRYQHPLQADGWAGMMLVAAFVAAIIALLVAGASTTSAARSTGAHGVPQPGRQDIWVVAGRFDDGFHTYVLEQNEWIFPFVPPSFRSLPLVCSVPFFLIIAPYDQHTDITSPLASITLRVLLYFAAAFYLIMNVTVGGTNGWFPDGPEKPWLDAAPRDFLQAKDLWYTSWPQDIERPAMVIDWVKIWEKCGSRG